MKVTVRVSYEVVDGGAWYSFKSKDYYVKPVRIIRYPCGSRGAAARRYYYQCDFVGFGDMLNINRQSAAGEILRENIKRKKNPHFNPKKLNWVGNVAIVE